MSDVKPIPDGYHAVTPYLICAGAAAAIDFYKQAFGAAEVLRMDGPGGGVGHAEIDIAGSKVMLSDEFPDEGYRGPGVLGGTPVMLHLYVPDVDATVAAAVAAGGTLQGEVADQFYGDRTGRIIDPFGHVWHIATHVEDLSEEEIKRRADEYMAQMAEG